MIRKNILSIQVIILKRKSSVIVLFYLEPFHSADIWTIFGLTGVISINTHRSSTRRSDGYFNPLGEAGFPVPNSIILFVVWPARVPRVPPQRHLELSRRASDVIGRVRLRTLDH